MQFDTEHCFFFKTKYKGKLFGECYLLSLGIPNEDITLLCELSSDDCCFDKGSNSLLLAALAVGLVAVCPSTPSAGPEGQHNTDYAKCILY